MKTPCRCNWGINMLDQFHSSLCRKQFCCSQEKFRKTFKKSIFKITIVTTGNWQRAKCITLFKHTPFRAVFTAQLNIQDEMFCKNS